MLMLHNIFRSLYITEEKEGVVELHNIGQVRIFCVFVYLFILYFTKIDFCEIFIIK